MESDKFKYAISRRSFGRSAVASIGVTSAAGMITAKGEEPGSRPESGIPFDPDAIKTPQEARAAMRSGRWKTTTTYKVPGYVQCNLVVLPKTNAFDFLVYCNRNRSACPVYDVTDPGDPEPRRAAPGADVRTDLPAYAVYRLGKLVDSPHDIRGYWRENAVAFLIGSSLTFDMPLQRAGVVLPPDVWVYRTNVQTVPAGKFHGHLIVTLRFFRPRDAIIATQLTSRFPFNHGAPFHIGNPADIGVDLENPIAGEPLKAIPPGRIAVFWACGVTPQQAALDSGIDWMITHKPGHGFITDLVADQVCIP